MKQQDYDQFCQRVKLAEAKMVTGIRAEGANDLHMHERVLGIISKHRRGASAKEHQILDEIKQAVLDGYFLRTQSRKARTQAVKETIAKAKIEAAGNYAEWINGRESNRQHVAAMWREQHKNQTGKEVETDAE